MRTPLVIASAVLALQIGAAPAQANQEQIVAEIDAIVAKLDGGEIDENQAIEALREAIPRPGNFPTRVVEYVVPSGAGGGSDTYARMIGHDAARIMGRSIAYNNMGGGGGQIALAYAVNQEPDGYTVYGTWAAQIIQCAVGGYQHCVATEMVPVIQNQGATEAFFVRGDSPFETWDDLIGYARENPGRIRVAGAGAMGDDELNVAYINNELDLRIAYFPFDEPGQRFGALLGGHVEVLYGTIGTVLDLIRDEQIRPVLLVTNEGSPEIDAFVPGGGTVPGAHDVGLEFPITRFRGIWTVPGTDPEIVDYLHNVLYASSQLPRYRNYEREAMMHLTRGYRNTEEFGAYSNRVIENLRPVLKELGYIE